MRVQFRLDAKLTRVIPILQISNVIPIIHSLPTYFYLG